METRMHAQLGELEGLLGQLESAAPALVRSCAAAVVAKEAAERLAERAKQSRPGAATVAAGVALLADAAREGKDGHTAAQEAAAVVAVAEARRPLQEALLEVQAQLQAREAEVETLRTSLQIAQQERQRPLPSTPKGADAARRLGQAPAAGAGAGALGTVAVPAAELDEIESTLSRLEMTLLRKGAWRAPPADAMMLSTPARARPVSVEQAPETAPEWELEPPSPIRFVVDLWQKVTGGQPEATPAPKQSQPVDAAGRGAGRGGAGRGVGGGRGGVSGARGSVGGGRGSGAGSPTGSAVAGAATAAANGFEMPDVIEQRRKDELLLVDWSSRSKELVAHGKACQKAVRAAVDEMAREVDRAQSEASIACGRLSLRVGEAELERDRARRELREAVVSGKVAVGTQLYRVPSPAPAPARAPAVAEKAAAEREAAEKAAAERAAEKAAAEKAAAERAAAEKAAEEKAAAERAAAERLAVERAAAERAEDKVSHWRMELGKMAIARAELCKAQDRVRLLAAVAANEDESLRDATKVRNEARVAFVRVLEDALSAHDEGEKERRSLTAEAAALQQQQQQGECALTLAEQVWLIGSEGL